jgi:hypothetical protein
MTEQPTEAQQIIAAERRAGALLARLGLSRRAALAHREHADLLAAGASQQQLDAAEMNARALTDAALADIDTDE